MQPTPARQPERRSADPDPVELNWRAAEKARGEFARLISGAQPAEVRKARKAYEEAYDVFIRTVPTTLEGLAVQVVAAGSGDAALLRNKDMRKVLASARRILLEAAKATKTERNR